MSHAPGRWPVVFLNQQDSPRAEPFTPEEKEGKSKGENDELVLCSQSLFRFADLGDDGLCRGGPDKGCGVIVSAIDVVVDRLD